MHCKHCGVDLLVYHNLVDSNVPPMKNHSPIIHPTCSICGMSISSKDIPSSADFSSQQLLLISGTAGSGKSALGQLISSKHSYVFIDGDAVCKQVKYYAKQAGVSFPAQELYHTDTLKTILITLALGYSVVCGYVFSPHDLSNYKQTLSKYKITPIIRILVPSRTVCINRDLSRECWTAGAYWIDKWFVEQQSYKNSNPELCLDTSSESLEETYLLHFASLLPASPNHVSIHVGGSYPQIS